ncbi:hypothetical protein LTR56_016587 [Elasticomyces elasticus]|nr:hypothetical protein LTR56_016587 [Elasticomyces elasticus]KAK3650618.1 hypothetical protein LTR22_012476 [Elasticomyces elasticus]KAK5753115.1 hypothetical protein LTS12_016794 [Elasticomyces elasticus]
MLPDYTVQNDLSSATHFPVNLESSPAAHLTFTTAETAVVLDHGIWQESPRASFQEARGRLPTSGFESQTEQGQHRNREIDCYYSYGWTQQAERLMAKPLQANFDANNLTSGYSRTSEYACSHSKSVTIQLPNHPASPKSLHLQLSAHIVLSETGNRSSRWQFGSGAAKRSSPIERHTAGAHCESQVEWRFWCWCSIDLADEDGLEAIAVVVEGEDKVDVIQGCCEGLVSYDGAADGTVAERIRQLEERRLRDAAPRPSTTNTTAGARVNLAAGRGRLIDGPYTRNVKAELHSPVAYLSGAKDKCVRHGRKPELKATNDMTSKSGYTDPCTDCRAELSIRRREAMHTVMRPVDDVHPLDDLVITQDLGGRLDAAIFESKGEIERVIINSRLRKSTTEVLLKLSEDMLSISQALAGAGAGPTVSTSSRTRQEQTVVFDTVAGHQRKYSVTELLELIDRAMEVEPASAVLPPIAFHSSPYHHAPEAPRYGVTGGSI